jgi:hypothetical protein
MSAQPIGLPGQPSTCAIGFHIAITIGDSTSGSPAGAIGLVWPSRDCQAWLSSVTYAPDAGLYTAGFCEPARIAAVASPEPLGLAVTWITLPPVTAWLALNALTCSSSQVFFSLPYTISSSTWSGADPADGASPGPPRGCDFSLQPAASAATTTPAITKRVICIRVKRGVALCPDGNIAKSPP